jgi:O-methyltransferase
MPFPFFSRLRYYYAKMQKERQHKKVFQKYKDYTMIPEFSYLANLALAEPAYKLEGAVVECGTWRGGMIAGIADLLGKSHRYHLFDSFEGLPPAKEVDGASAIEWQKDIHSPGYHDNCTAEVEWAERAMGMSAAASVNIHKGWFEDTLGAQPFAEPISLLLLDGDWYDSTMTCLENLFPKVVPGGLILIDDYHTWDGCSRAVHDYLSKHSKVERIREHNGVCYLVKAP